MRNQIQVVVASLAVVVLSINCQAQGDSIREEVETAWKAREKACHSVKCEYTTHWIHKPPYSGIKETIEHEAVTRFWIDGPQMRYELEGPVLAEGKLTDQHIVSSFDGVRSATMGSPTSDIKHSQGHVYQGDSCDGLSTFDIRPVTWTFFPFDYRRCGYNFEKLRLLEEKSTVDGVECVVAEMKYIFPPGARYAGGDTELFYLDPTRGYSLVRYTLGTKEVITNQLDCQYELSKEQWLPTSWTTWRFGSEGEPFEVGTSTVKLMEISPEFQEGDFQVVFPTGTVVSDFNSHDNVGRSGTYDYIVKSDGSKRQITWEERFADHERLMNTETGQAGIPMTSLRSYMLLIVNLCAFAAIGALCFIKSRSGKPQPPG